MQTATTTMEKRIHYGSIEEQERAERHTRKEQHALNHLEAKGLILEDLSSSINQHHSSDQIAILNEYDRKQQLKNIIVPTNDVKGPAERRDRLRELLSNFIFLNLDFDDGDDDFDDNASNASSVEGEFYTHGDAELLIARRLIAQTSLALAKSRLLLATQQCAIPSTIQKKALYDFYSKVKLYTTCASQFGDNRPLSNISFSPDSTCVATTSWSGPVKLWTVPNSTLCHTFKGHKDRACSTAFHPDFCYNDADPLSSTMDMVSAGVDGSVYAWSLSSETPIASFVGHDVRVTKVAFHPSCHNYIATASFDNTWCLWDTQTQTELQCQEGHSRPLFALGFQGDGSVLATGGNDAIARVWDIRSGRSVMVLQGHVKGILDLDWYDLSFDLLTRSPNGYHIATASEDHTIRVWDLRGRGSGCITTIPAHTNLVSSVKYYTASASKTKHQRPSPGNDDDMRDIQDDDTRMRDINDQDDHNEQMENSVCNGSFLASSSYDGTCKLWSIGDFKAIKTFSSGAGSKIMSCDVSGDARLIGTAAYDRTFQLHGLE